MSKSTKYLLISLPTSITPSHHRDDALDAITATISPDNGSVTPFPIPEFKIGTLDALVQQADELAKLEAACQGVVGKVGDALRNILDGDEGQIEKMKTVNDSMLATLFPVCCGKEGCEVRLTEGRACGSVPSDILVE
jgi:V-type H+-transporting ATPase subunit C